MTDHKTEGGFIIDTPDGIAFFRATARLGALKLGRRGVLAIVKQVYGFTGTAANVASMLQEYVDGVLEVRAWAPERGKRAQEIAQEAIRRVEEEHGATPRLQQLADANVQAAFDAGTITEQEGNDACLLLYVEVVRQRAGSR